MSTSDAGSPRPFRSIRSKLARLVLVSVGIALLVGGSVSLWQEASRYHETRRESLLASAQAFAAAAADAVARRDAATVTRILGGIGRIPRLVRAVVVTPDGARLAEAGSTVRLDGDVEIDESRSESLFGLLASRTVQVTIPVIHAGEAVGRLSLIRDASDLVPELLRSLLIVAAGGLVSLAVGLVLSHRLQAAITTPLSRLTQAMARVERTGDYSAPPGIATDDETGALAASFESMMREIRRATDEILERENEIIERLSRAGEQRDDQTGQHVVRVARISRLIAEELGLESGFVDDLVRASPMHDVGKISVPDRILFKPGRLDPDERREMEQHAERGHDVLAGSRSHLVQLAAEIAISHHERWDGEGYPRRLSGHAIPLSGRITAVADVCDALLCDRPYKKAWPLAEVRAHLIAGAGSHFDPDCIDALMARWADLEAIYALPAGAPRTEAA